MPKGKQRDLNTPTGVNRQEKGHSNSSSLSTAPNGINTGYEIRIKDHLNTYWYEWFEGWNISNLECGEVLLRRYNVDQSALHGALNKIRDLNLLLLSVTQTSKEVTK
jgi:hypothetical protein